MSELDTALDLIKEGLRRYTDEIVRNGLDYEDRNRLHTIFSVSGRQNDKGAAIMAVLKALDERNDEIIEAKQETKEVEAERDLVYTKLADCRIEKRLLEDALADEGSDSTGERCNT